MGQTKLERYHDVNTAFKQASEAIKKRGNIRSLSYM